MSKSNTMKISYEVNITPEALAGIKTIAAKFNLSISKLFEQVGCGVLAVIDSEEIEDYLDLQDALEAEANPENQDTIPWEKVKQELGL